MPLSKAHKAETRARIVTAAGQLFRRHGYNGVGIERVMAEAGMTHGGFYAHFSSKAQLLAAVMADEREINERLARRRGGNKAKLNEQLGRLLDYYLDPGNVDDIGGRCFLASLSNDAARAPAMVKRRYTETITDLVHEFMRGLPTGAAHKRKALESITLALGAITMARAIDDPALSAKVLRTSRKAIAGRLAQKVRPAPPFRPMADVPTTPLRRERIRA